MRLQADFLDRSWGASLRALYCGCGEGRFRAEGAPRAGRGRIGDIGSKTPPLATPPWPGLDVTPLAGPAHSRAEKNVLCPWALQASS